jgi:flavodoxin
MKALIVFYSRTGTTKRVAEALQKKLGCDIEEIVDKKKRLGPIGYMLAGRDVIKKSNTKISETKYNPDNYDLVIIGTPVWMGTMAVAIKTYLEMNKDKLKNVAFFSTQGSDKRQRVFDEITGVIMKEPIAEVYLTTNEVVDNNFEDKLAKFISKINNSNSRNR